MYRRKNIIIIVMIITVLLMGTGYAILSTQLKINGTANVTGSWNIAITSVESTATGRVYNIKSPTYTATNMTFQVGVKEPGDKMTFTVTVKNNGNVDAILDSIDVTAIGSYAIIYSIKDLQEGTKLLKGESKTFKVITEFDIDSTTLPEEPIREIRIGLNYIQDDGQTVVPKDPVMDEPGVLVEKILASNVAQSDENIDFSKISSDSNGKGLYYTSTNTEDNKRTYYFRGQVDNNYVSFAGHIWRIVRINEDSSIRLIYQGKTANATGTNTQIGTSPFNTLPGDNAHVGYMYGTPPIYKDGYGTWNSSTSYYTRISTTSTVKMSTSYTFNSSTGDYTLVSPVDGKYTSEYYNYYTCISATGVTCTRMIKLTNAATNNGYNELKGGEIHTAYFSETYEEAHNNEVDSTIKITIDNWYRNNLLSYSNYIADSGFCNDRTLYSGTGVGKAQSYYGAYGRLGAKKTPQFKCPNEDRDLFTTSTSNKGNKALDYPIGLITADEVSFAGGVYGSSNTNSSYYLYTGVHYWTMSPFNFYSSDSRASGWRVSLTGYLGNYGVNNNSGVRPIINLKSNVEITKGTGTKSNPYVIKTS